MATSNEVSRLTQVIAETLRAEVAVRGLSGTKIAQQAGLSQTRFSKIYRGEDTPRIDELDRICAALGLNFRDVVLDAAGRTSDRPLPEPIPPRYETT